MLTFAYNLGGWVIANAYISKISKYLEKNESLSMYPHSKSII